MTPNERIFFEPISGREERWVREESPAHFLTELVRGDKNEGAIASHFSDRVHTAAASIRARIVGFKRMSLSCQ